MSDEKPGTKPAMDWRDGLDLVLNHLRNPYGRTADEMRGDRLDAANRLEAAERLSRAPLTAEWMGCEWTMPRPPGMPFRVYKKDETDRHSAWYVVMPGGAMIEFNHHADDDVDHARAVFVSAACNAAVLPPDGALIAAANYLDGHALCIRESHCQPPDYTDWNDEHHAHEWHDEVLALATALRDAACKPVDDDAATHTWEITGNAHGWTATGKHKIDCRIFNGADQQCDCGAACKPVGPG